MNSLIQGKQRLFDRWAGTYDWLFPSIFYQAIHKRLLEYVTLPEAARVLDLGCGTGKLLNRLAAQYPTLSAIGFDVSSQMLQQARRSNRHRPRLIYVQGNAEQLPFATGYFHAVFNTISFLHYPQPHQVLQEVSRVLVAGGCFYLVDFAAHQGARIGSGAQSLKFYSPEEREKLGTQAALKCQGHYFLLGPVLLSIFQR